MADTGVLQTPQTIPNAAQPGMPGSRASFFLRSTPQVFTVISAGNSNQDFQIRAAEPVDIQQVLLGSRTFKRLAALSSPIELSGLVHERSIGALVVSVSFAVTGLDHARALGSVTIPAAPPEPPVPPVPPPSPVVSSPRTLRYVRRRNRPRES